jgi:hypothetical protein
MQHVTSLTVEALMLHPANTALARAFISILSDPEAAAESGGLRNALAIVDAEAVTTNKVRADLATAAALLAKAISATDGLLDALLSGTPAVTILMPVKEMADAMETVIEECLLLPFRDDVPRANGVHADQWGALVSRHDFERLEPGTGSFWCCYRSFRTSRDPGSRSGFCHRDPPIGQRGRFAGY